MRTTMGTGRQTLFLLLALLGGIRASNTAFSLFFNEIRACLLSNQIPPVSHSDETVKVILAASQDETRFERVMDCVNRKVKAYSASTSPSHAFVKMVFGLKRRHQKLKALAHRANSLYQLASKDEFSCIAKKASKPNLFDNCLTYHDTENAIDKGMDYSCSAHGTLGLTRACLEMRSQFHNNCTNTVSEMTVVFTEVLFIKCDESASTYSIVTITPTSPTPYPFHRSAIDWMDSAFVRCSEQAYPTQPLEFMYIFPPSEFSIKTIQSATKQTFKRHHINALSHFCSNVAVYSECVKQKFASGKTFTDTYLRMFVDGNNFGNTMTKYCQNQTLVTSQFDCMVDSVQKTRCNGGVLDLLHTSLFNLEQIMGFIYSCSDIYKSQQCRIDKQLSVCEPQFAGLMEETIKNLLVPECRNGGYISRSSETEIMSCMTEYYVGLSSRSRSQPETFQDPSLIADFVVTEMGHFCAAYDGMLDCVEEKIETSEKTVDIMIREYSSLKNVRGVLKYLCGKKEVIKNNLRCLMLEVGSLVSKRNSCLQSITVDSRITMTKFSNMTAVEQFDSEEMRRVMCPMTKEFGACFKPSFDKCSAEAGDMLDTLIGYFYNSCMDPKYEVKPESQTGGSSVARPLLPVLSTLIMTLLIDM